MSVSGKISYKLQTWEKVWSLGNFSFFGRRIKFLKWLRKWDTRLNQIICATKICCWYYEAKCNIRSYLEATHHLTGDDRTSHDGANRDTPTPYRWWWTLLAEVSHSLRVISSRGAGLENCRFNSEAAFVDPSFASNSNQRHLHNMWPGLWKGPIRLIPQIQKWSKSSF